MFTTILKQTQRSIPHSCRSYHTTNSRLSQPQNCPARFRSCVGAIIFNKEGKLLCGKRIDIAHWQFPQGGMHPEEDVVTAAAREVGEEIGITRDQLRVVQDKNIPQDKYTYHRSTQKDGNKYDGQEQRYVLFRWDGLITQCNLDPGPEPPEFSEVAWLTWDELINRSVPSRTFIYARLRNTLKPVINDCLSKDQPRRIDEGLDGPSSLIPKSVSSTAITWSEYLSPYVRSDEIAVTSGTLHFTTSSNMEIGTLLTDRN